MTACPSCGFDTPEDQAWCEMCKEPLGPRKGKPVRAKDDPPLMPPPMYASKEDVHINMQVEGIVESMKNDLNADKVRSGIPPQFAGLDSGKRVAPPTASLKVTWILIGITCIFLTLYLFKINSCGDAKMLERVFPQTIKSEGKK